MHVPPPPWHLTGRAAVFLHSWREVQLLVSYDTSPVGPYEEYAIVTVTRRGPSVTVMEVTSEASRLGGRVNWGFPKVVGSLQSGWRQGSWWFRHQEKNCRVRPIGPPMPFRLSAFTVQELSGTPVRVPTRATGSARLAFRGRQLGIFIWRFSVTVLPPSPLIS